MFRPPQSSVPIFNPSVLYALLWSGQVASMWSPMHVVHFPSWCYTGRSSVAPRRQQRLLRHKWHYSNLPGWYAVLLTLIHVGLPIWTPPHVHDTCNRTLQPYVKYLRAPDYRA